MFTAKGLGGKFLLMAAAALLALTVLSTAVQAQADRPAPGGPIPTGWFRHMMPGIPPNPPLPPRPNPGDGLIVNPLTGQGIDPLSTFVFGLPPQGNNQGAGGAGGGAGGGQGGGFGGAPGGSFSGGRGASFAGTGRPVNNFTGRGGFAGGTATTGGSFTGSQGISGGRGGGRIPPGFGRKAYGFGGGSFADTATPFHFGFAMGGGDATREAAKGQESREVAVEKTKLDTLPAHKAPSIAPTKRREANNQ